MKKFPPLPALPDHDANLNTTLKVLSLQKNFSRRQALGGLFGLAGLTSTTQAQISCTVIPSETAGPYPGDGTNGPNALTQSGILRSDMRSNFGASGTSVAPGVPLTVNLQITNTNGACGALTDYAVYLWHCDAVGNYSMYGTVVSLNYLRAVQITDSNGMVSFKTIFPGCYSGRWPHMHFEIYKTAADAVNGRNAVRTSQLALPQAECSTVYTTQASVYSGSTANLSRITLSSDGIFSDGYSTQMASMTGSVDTGYTATLKVAIAGPTVTTPVNTNVKTVEFYNSVLNQYVMLTNAGEIAAVESGAAGAGWSRTGAVLENEPSPGSNSYVVHRFYGSINLGPNSHFYTISNAERDYLIDLASKTPATQKRWNYESAGGFWAGLASNNSCVANNGGYVVPVYRLYNNGHISGKDSNHRYTSSMTIAAQMQAKGWTLEGVVFCAVVATVASS